MALRIEQVHEPLNAVPRSRLDGNLPGRAPHAAGAAKIAAQRFAQREQPELVGIVVGTLQGAQRLPHRLAQRFSGKQLRWKASVKEVVGNRGVCGGLEHLCQNALRTPGPIGPASFRRHSRIDVITRAVPGHDIALGVELLVGLIHGVARNAQLFRHIAHRRQLCVGLVNAAHNVFAQALVQLDVGRCCRTSLNGNHARPLFSGLL